MKCQRTNNLIGDTLRNPLWNDRVGCIPSHRVRLYAEDNRLRVIAANLLKVSNVYFADATQKPFRRFLNVLPEHVPMFSQWNNR
jgi:hypothetical protein